MIVQMKGKGMQNSDGMDIDTRRNDGTGMAARALWVLVVWAMPFSSMAASVAGLITTNRSIVIEWSEGRPEGQLSITDGRIVSLAVQKGQGQATADGKFTAQSDGPFRVAFQVEGSHAAYGPGTMLVHVDTPRNPFAFFVRDVQTNQPIFIPEYHVAVNDAVDARSYAQIAADIARLGLESKFDRMQNEPEESFENAAASARKMAVQTWLGLGRDMRIFAVSERLDWIQPKFHGMDVPLPEFGNGASRYSFLMGRGWGVADNIERRLEDGVLPILHGTLADEEVTYQFTGFVGLESHPLTPANLRGTHYLVADGHGHGHMFTKEQDAQYQSLLAAERDQPEETVLFMRIRAVNTGRTPRHAFFKNILPSGAAYTFDGTNGHGVFNTGRVFAISRLDGKPLAQEEIAVLLQPGAATELEIVLPHRPIDATRARALGAVKFDDAHASVKTYWTERLASAAKIELPETRINEMIRAGLLHLDLVTYGRETNDTLTATIGVYSAIGSESSPIIQFMDSMGWHDQARRALMYFLDKQHDDGFIQNFGGYMLETGAALWSIGEHYRYTRDEAWVRQITPKLVKACEYLHRWRERNLREDLRGRGYGMLEGKTADPEDLFRSYMLNGYACLGISRVAEMLRESNPAESRRWQQEADALKADIRTSFFQAMGRSPVAPAGNGTWTPTAPPWAEYRGPLTLFADGGNWFTHGAMNARDSLLGPIYLILQEVIDPNEPAAGFLLRFHNELFTRQNVAFSQPYYSRHPMAHLMRGEVKPFLKAYYNTVASLADRQTYTFWEHFFGASPHKTHEEGWFLMDTRWMLCREQGPGLILLGGVPRAYLADGKTIRLEKVATYFGPVSLRVDSQAASDRITATVESDSSRKPAFIQLRLPHPDGLRAVAVQGGVYDPQREMVHVEPFNGKAVVTLQFSR